MDRSRILDTKGHVNGKVAMGLNKRDGPDINSKCRTLGACGQRYSGFDDCTETQALGASKASTKIAWKEFETKLAALPTESAQSFMHLH